MMRQPQGRPSRSATMEPQSKSTMRAASYDRYGSFDVLNVLQVPRPVAEGQEVIVGVAAAALGIGDCFSVRGSPLVMRLATGLLKPKYGVPGFDVAGRVEAVGA